MIFNEHLAAATAEILLENKAVILRPHQPFTWASGWLSPIYCDNRVLLSYPKSRSIIIENFCEIIKVKFPDAQVIAGVATAGIAHAALIADKLELPMAYIRSKPKDHGTAKLIEGRIETDSRVVVIEDLVSTGKSSLAAVEAVRESGANVLGMAAIFSYNFIEAEMAFNESNTVWYCLSNYEHLIESAMHSGYIKQDELSLLKEWRMNPAEWGK